MSNLPPTPSGKGPPSLPPKKAAARAPVVATAVAVDRSLFLPGDLGFIGEIGADAIFLPETRTALKAVTIGAQSVPIADLVVVKNSPEWWFQYFWKEAADKTNQSPNRDRILGFLNRIFFKPPNFTTTNKFVIPKGELMGTVGLSAVEVRAGLKAILEAGFDYIALGATGNPTASSAAMLAFGKMAADTVHYRLVWRGEDRRSLEELRKGGYDTQANDEDWARRNNMREAWHPFSEDDVRQKLWYRKGQNDNCLYTVVSVATDWRASACFPKVEQTVVLSEIAQKAGTLAKLGDLRAKYPEQIGRVTYNNGKSDYRLVTTSKVALIVLDGLYLDTRARQEDSSLGAGAGTGYPELGVSKVAKSNVLGMVEYLRVHHGLDDHSGFTAFPRRGSSRMVSRDELVMTFLDEKAKTEYYATVEVTFTEALSRKVGLKWTTTGFSTIDPMSDIRMVEIGTRVVSFS